MAKTPRRQTTNVINKPVQYCLLNFVEAQLSDCRGQIIDRKKTKVCYQRKYSKFKTILDHTQTSIRAGRDTFVGIMDLPDSPLKPEAQKLFEKLRPQIKEELTQKKTIPVSKRREMALSLSSTNFSISPKSKEINND